MSPSRRRNPAVIIFVTLVVVQMVPFLVFWVPWTANFRGSDQRSLQQQAFPGWQDTTRFFASDYLQSYSSTQQRHRQPGDASSSSLLSSPDQQLQRILSPRRPSHLCPNTQHLFPNTTVVLDAIAKAEAYHKRGGNFQAMQDYLNDHIDYTLETLQLEYQPGPDQPKKTKKRYKMKHKPNPQRKSKVEKGDSIAQFIKDELIYHDWNDRGGYNQRKLPGHFVVRPHNNNINGGDKNVAVSSPPPPPLPPPPPALREGRFVDVIEPNSWERWEAALGPIGPNCTSVNRIQRNAEPHYLDKYMCSYTHLVEAKEQEQQQQQQQQQHQGGNVNITKDDDSTLASCHIISIGSNNQWDFEEAVTMQTNCITHTFDCTVTNPTNMPNSTRVKFYPVCIGSTNTEVNGRQYRTYTELIKIASLQEPPKLLKMDIEGFEFDVLSAMVDSKSDDDKQEEEHNNDANIDYSWFLPEQIEVELHYASRMYDLPSMLHTRQAAEMTLLIGRLYEWGGYLPVFVDYSTNCAPCLETVFVKVLC